MAAPCPRTAFTSFPVVDGVVLWIQGENNADVAEQSCAEFSFSKCPAGRGGRYAAAGKGQDQRSRPGRPEGCPTLCCDGGRRLPRRDRPVSRAGRRTNTRRRGSATRRQKKEEEAAGAGPPISRPLRPAQGLPAPPGAGSAAAAIAAAAARAVPAPMPPAATAGGRWRRPTSSSAARGCWPGCPWSSSPWSWPGPTTPTWWSCVCVSAGTEGGRAESRAGGPRAALLGSSAPRCSTGEPRGVTFPSGVRSERSCSLPLPPGPGLSPEPG